jgi:hypothetical protein
VKTPCHPDCRYCTEPLRVLHEVVFNESQYVHWKDQTGDYALRKVMNWIREIVCHDAIRGAKMRREPADPATTQQQAPVPTDSPSMHDLVIEDVLKRKAMGLEKYKVLLQAHNGRRPLWDAYQEVLDLAVYLRQEIEERGV